MKRIDASSLLRLHTPFARALVALLILTQYVFVAFSVSAMKSAPLAVAALVVFTAGALVIAQPHSDPFPVRWTAAVLVSGTATNILVLWNLPNAGWPGYASWNFGAVTWLLFFLAFRGRIPAAWAGLAVMAGLTVVWAVSVGRTPLEGIDLVARHAGTLLIGTLFSVLLRKVSARIAALQNESVVQAGAESASFAELRERELQARQLTVDARPVLERIAGGELVDPARQREYALLEASLRDTLRGAGLASDEVSAAVLQARRRGAQVVLLDDRNKPLPPLTAQRVHATIVGELSTLRVGRMTVRLLPAGRDTIATLVRSDDAAARRRIELRADELDPVPGHHG